MYTGGLYEAVDMIPVYPAGWNENAVCVTENSIWFFHNEINALIEFFPEENRAEYRGSVSGEPFFARELYSHIFFENGFLYLVPYRGKTIQIYDIRKEAFVACEREQISNVYVEGKLHLMKCAFVYGQYIYIIPANCNDDILKFDMKARLIKNKISIGGVYGVCTGCKIEIDGDAVYIPVYGYNGMPHDYYIIDLNLKNDTVHFESITNMNDGIVSLGILDDNIIASEAHGDGIYIIDRVRWECVKRIDGVGRDPVILSKYKRDFFLEAGQLRGIYKLDENNTLSIVGRKKGIGKFGIIIKYKDKIFYFDRISGEICALNNSSREESIKWTPTIRIEAFYTQALNNTEAKNILYEDNAINLKLLCQKTELFIDN